MGGGRAAVSTIGTLRDELVATVLVVVGVLCGPVAAWYAIDWAVNGLRDLMNVPELSPVPIDDRKPGVPGPTFTYWLAWAIPPALVYGIGGLLFWRKKSTRWFIGGFMVGFLTLSGVLVPLFISMDVGGFAPD